MQSRQQFVIRQRWNMVAEIQKISSWYLFQHGYRFHDLFPNWIPIQFLRWWSSINNGPLPRWPYWYLPFWCRPHTITKIAAYLWCNYFLFNITILWRDANQWKTLPFSVIRGVGGRHDICQIFYTSMYPNIKKFTRRKGVNRDISSPLVWQLSISNPKTRIMSQSLTCKVTQYFIIGLHDLIIPNAKIIPA